MQDPLAAYSGLSIFQRTFQSLSKPPPSGFSDDLLSTHNFLKSLPIRNPGRLIQEAKAILESNSDFKEVGMSGDVLPGHKRDVTETFTQSPRGHRPGLGRKRARFSLLPNLSETTAMPEPVLDIDKLKDPEEFFTAFERMEKAKREIAKQTGCAPLLTGSSKISPAQRPQRQGIPGRSKTVRYKHLYPVTSSQPEVLHPVDGTPKRELEISASQGKDPANIERAPVDGTELTNSIKKAEDSINKLLDKLISHKYEEPNDDITSHPPIKPVDVSKLTLPELPAIRTVDFTRRESKLHKPPIDDDLAKNKRKKTPKVMKEAGRAFEFGSPTPPKSPLAALSLLKKHILLTKRASEQFPATDFDGFVTGNKSEKVGNVLKEDDETLSCLKKSPSFPKHDKFTSRNVTRGEVAGLSDGDIVSRNTGSGLNVDVQIGKPSGEDNLCSDGMEGYLEDQLVQEDGMDTLPMPGKDANRSDSCLPLPHVVDEGICVQEPRNLKGISLTDKAVPSEENLHPDRLESQVLSSEISDGTHQASEATHCTGAENVPTDPAQESGLQDNGEAPAVSMTELDNGEKTKKKQGRRAPSRRRNVPDHSGVMPAVVQIDTRIEPPVPTFNVEQSSGHGVGASIQTAELPVVCDPKSHNELEGEDQEPHKAAKIHVAKAKTRASRKPGQRVKPSRKNLTDNSSSVVPKGSRGRIAKATNNNLAQHGTSNFSSSSTWDVVEHDRSSDITAMEEKEAQASHEVTTKALANAKSRYNKRSGSTVVANRQSLGASGTLWENGIRKSTRIRSRPLEYWKGERFLYGRIHGSLATVIGVKYESPGTGRKPAIKVKSFVSADYEHLLKIAAL